MIRFRAIQNKIIKTTDQLYVLLIKLLLIRLSSKQFQKKSLLALKESLELRVQLFCFFVTKFKKMK